MKQQRVPTLARQCGSVIVEFALTVSLLLTIMELSRMMFYWNTATEATRLGARIAAVCALDHAEIRHRMTTLFPIIVDADIQIEYWPGGCSASDCEQLTVSIAKPDRLQLSIPLLSQPLLPWPKFSTSLPRESMNSNIAGSANPVCG
jgi:hypothetical protein